MPLKTGIPVLQGGEDVKLSPRQREVIAFIAAGHAPKNCRDIIGISYGTFRSHLLVAYAKLGARNDAHAVAIALRTGVID